MEPAVPSRIAICLALAGLLSFPALAQQTPAPSGENAEAIAAAMQCLDDFMAAFNAHDLKAFEATLNFPHVRLNGANALKIFSRGDMKDGMFENMEAKGWDHSAWDKRDVLSAGPNKVHIKTRFVRYRADNSVLSAYDSLYVVTKEGGHWGIRIRSSFAY
jgi:hypothetical protein